MSDSNGFFVWGKNLEKTDFIAKFQMVLKHIHQSLMEKVQKISQMSLDISGEVFYANFIKIR